MGEKSGVRGLLSTFIFCFGRNLRPVDTAAKKESLLPAKTLSHGRLNLTVHLMQAFDSECSHGSLEA